MSSTDTYRLAPTKPTKPLDTVVFHRFDPPHYPGERMDDRMVGYRLAAEILRRAMEVSDKTSEFFYTDLVSTVVDANKVRKPGTYYWSFDEGGSGYFNGKHKISQGYRIDIVIQDGIECFYEHESEVQVWTATFTYIDLRN